MEKNKTVIEVIREVCEDICDNYCKYAGTGDEDFICDPISENGCCPLDAIWG